jgi:hypothetical protein
LKVKNLLRLFTLVLTVSATLISSCTTSEEPKPKSEENSILEFKIQGKLATIVERERNESTITIQFTGPMDVTALAPEIQVSPGATVSPASGEAQDFTGYVTYEVTAENGTTNYYRVEVVIVNGLQSFQVTQSDKSYAGTIDHEARVINVDVDLESMRELIKTNGPFAIDFELAEGTVTSAVKGRTIDIDKPGEITITTPDNGSITYQIKIRNTNNIISYVRLEENPIVLCTDNEHSYEMFRTENGITVRVLSTLDVSNIIPFEFVYSERATITPAVNMPMNLDNLKSFYITSESGNGRYFSVRVVKQDILFENDYPSYVKEFTADSSPFSLVYQSVSPVVSARIVYANHSSSGITCDFTTSVLPDNRVSITVDPQDKFVPAGDYYLTVKLANGRSYLINMILRGK